MDPTTQNYLQELLGTLHQAQAQPQQASEAPPTHVRQLYKLQTLETPIFTLQTPSASTLLKRRRAPHISKILAATQGRILSKSHHKRCASSQLPVSKAQQARSATKSTQPSSRLPVLRTRKERNVGLIEELPPHVRAWDSGVARYNGHMATYHAQSARRREFKAKVQQAAAAAGESIGSQERLDEYDEMWQQEGWQRVEVARLDYFSFGRIDLRGV